MHFGEKEIFIYSPLTSYDANSDVNLTHGLLAECDALCHIAHSSPCSCSTNRKSLLNEGSLPAEISLRHLFVKLRL